MPATPDRLDDRQVLDALVTYALSHLMDAVMICRQRDVTPMPMIAILESWIDRGETAQRHWQHAQHTRKPPSKRNSR